MAHTRRELLTGWWDRILSPPLPAREAPVELLPDYLRPPGAIAEGEFKQVCERCGECRQACPHGVILPLGPAYGRAHGTPAILPRDGACRLCQDLPCVEACPSGALQKVPISDIRMGLARLDAAQCFSAQGQPCDYCMAECPLEPKALRMEGNLPVVESERCVGCGMCAFICPTMAVRVQSAE